MNPYHTLAHLNLGQIHWYEFQNRQNAVHHLKAALALDPFLPNCQTTAMGIMPHPDVERALEVALSLDIPFWPQLPKVSYFEDMYVQALENFPGVRIDVVNQKIFFDLSRLYEELPSYFEKADDPRTFQLTKDFSLVYHQFLGGKKTTQELRAVNRKIHCQ